MQIRITVQFQVMRVNGIEPMRADFRILLQCWDYSNRNDVRIRAQVNANMNVNTSTISKSTKLKHTEINVVPEEEAHGPRHDDGRCAVRDQVDGQQRQRGESGQQQLVPPADVEHVVREAEQQHATDAQQASDELHKLRKENHFK